MNEYKELIEMLRSRSVAIIREDAKLVDIPEENIWDADANVINDAADAIERLVEESNAFVDAVPVVRCKDCIHATCEEPGMVYCPAVYGSWVDNDFFCKDGERGDDNGA